MAKKIIYRKNKSTEILKLESVKLEKYSSIDEFLKAKGINPDEVEVNL